MGTTGVKLQPPFVQFDHVGPCCHARQCVYRNSSFGGDLRQTTLKSLARRLIFWSTQNDPIIPLAKFFGGQ